MYIIIWRFDVKPECISQFEKYYAHDGSWAQLFRHAGSEYLGTELLKDHERQNSYLTIDGWVSGEAYDGFMEKWCGEYDVLDRQCESFTLQEVQVGIFS